RDGVGAGAHVGDGGGEDFVLGHAVGVRAALGLPLLDHVVAGLGVGGARGDGLHAGVEDVHGGLEVEVGDEGVGEEVVVQEVVVPDDADVQAQFELVRDRAADVVAGLEEAEGLGKGGLADDVEGEVVNPLVEVDWPAGRGLDQVGELVAEERYAVVDVGFAGEDVAEGVARRDVLGSADFLVVVGLRHPIATVPKTAWATDSPAMKAKTRSSIVLASDLSYLPFEEVVDAETLSSEGVLGKHNRMIEDGGLEKTTGCMDSGLAFGLASDCGNISVQSVSFKTIFSSVMVRWVVVITYKGAQATEEYARNSLPLKRRLSSPSTWDERRRRVRGCAKITVRSTDDFTNTVPTVQSTSTEYSTEYST
ncbi:hypothetical protein V491_05375, partial [Pseudogymnoascus sp. VKM F-3775]